MMFYQTLYSETLGKSADFPQENARKCSGNLLSMLLKFGPKFRNNSFLTTFSFLIALRMFILTLSQTHLRLSREKSLN